MAMKKYFTQCTILSFFLLLGAPGSGRVATDEAAAMTSEITVRVYNYAAVPEQRMARAQQHAAAVFAKADLQPRWVDCRLSGAEPIKDAACEEPLRPTDVVLRILPQKMAARLPVKAAICGFALPAKYLGFGIATVLYQRVDELVSRGSFSTDGNSARALVLGYIIAHEVGHLLLGKGSHAARGLMSFPWNKKELKEAAWGGLLFTRGQKRRIQAALLERIVSPQDFQRDLSSRASR
jgi:hypothetical protein